MELTQILNQALQVLFLLSLVLIILFFKTPFFKGWFGEFIINDASKLFLNKNEYHLLKNVTLPTEDGTTQIDHIIVSKFGIFVVETKNMKGWIFGGQQQKMWTQQIYKHKYKFQNPLHQNYKHIKTLENALDIDAAKIFSVIVFLGKNMFKTPMPENVTDSIGYINYIKSKKRRLFSRQELIEIIAKIESGKLQPSLKTHRQHIKHVKSITSEKKNNNEKICPKCGNKMVLRTAKTGKHQGQNFWGCTNFPKCRAVEAVIDNNLM